MISSGFARVDEIAQRAPELVSKESALHARRRDLDRQYGTLRRANQPIPPELPAEQRQVRAEIAAVQREREQLLIELDEHRTQFAQRQREYKSRTAARGHGHQLSSAEFAAVTAQLRREQAVLDYTRNWLDGTTT
ncbi:hypothetical protein [Nocardia nova]|uniref:hypothetical protein n=1 Tax=Nocardia nova TaxID=37330 RepID=UPI0033F62BEA